METVENTAAVAAEPTVNVDQLAKDLAQLEVAHPGIVKRLKAAAAREIAADALRPIVQPLVDAALEREAGGKQEDNAEKPKADLEQMARSFFEWFTVDEILGCVGLIALLASTVPGVSKLAREYRDDFEKDIANAACEVMVNKGRATSLECEDAEDAARIMFVARLLGATANRVAGSPESVEQATQEAYDELRMIGIYSPPIQKTVLLRYITEDLPTAIREELENEEALFGEHGIFTEHLKGDEPVGEDDETCFDAVVAWLRSQSREAKLTAVLLNVLLSHEHVLPDKSIANDLYREFEVEVLASDEGDFGFIAAYTAGMMAVPC